MTAQTRTILKNYFLRGLRPTQSQYSDLIDSFPLISGDTMTGPLTLSGNPSSALHAAPKQYVDSVVGGAVSDGDKGDITVSSSGTVWTIDSAAVTVVKGGTGLATLTANNVILGNGTSSPTFVAPSTSGNVLTSNGTTWTSAANPTGLTWISTQTAAASASLSFTSGISSTYGIYIFEGTALVPASDDVYFIMEYSVDGGSNWLATGYVTQNYQVKGSTTINQTTPTDAVHIIPNSAGFRADSGATNDGLHFTARLYRPSASGVKYTKGDATWFEAAGAAAVIGSFSGCNRGDVSAVNAVRFRFSSGNIATGNIAMLGVKTS